MKDTYCKLKDSNKIYSIVRYEKENVILKNKNIYITTNKNNITVLSDDFVPQNTTGKSSLSITSKDVSSEIMLRHKLKEEAISDLDKYIDQAIIAKIGRVRIIHGRHGGVLREAVHEYLRTHPFVKEFFIANYNEGGIGVTIAILGKRH